jgi:pimeloyl-ACP methyl ester carboxylesterase
MTGKHSLIDLFRKCVPLAALFTIMTLSAGRAAAQPTLPQDTSKHTARMVTVADGVQLEVLDWGGNGRPLVFLAGLGATAHDFDGFAPRFAGKYHVYGITRRGFGLSSKPSPDDNNYSAGRLGDDVLAVIDTLKLDRPVLVGASLAGEELSSVADRRPDRLAGVIYLDAAYAYAYYTPGTLNPANANLTMDIKVLRQKIKELAPLWQKPPEGVAAIDALLNSDLPQLRQDLIASQAAMRKMPPAPPMPAMPPGAAQSPQAKINQAIQDGIEKFGTLKVPVLAVFAAPHAPPPNAPSPAMLEYFTAVDKIANAGLAERYRKGNPEAHVVVLASVQHAMFKSNPGDVAREMEAFLARLPQAGAGEGRSP